MGFELLLNITEYWSELFSGRILVLYVEYFLYLMYFKDPPFITFSINLAIMRVL